MSCSGLHAARKRLCRPKPVCALSVQAKAAFESSGHKRWQQAPERGAEDAGLGCGRHRARTLMRINGLRARWRRKFAHTTDSRYALPMAANVLARQFNPETPSRAWVCDITYMRTCSGWLYLAMVLACFRAGSWDGPRRRACRPSWYALRSAWPLQAAKHCRVYWCIQTVATNTPVKSTRPCWHTTDWLAAWAEKAIAGWTWCFAITL